MWAWACLMVWAAAPDTWDAVHHYGPLTVWTRSPKGDSPIHELRAQAELRVDAKDVWAAIDDSAAYPNFLPHVEALHVVSSSSSRARYEYALVDAPMTAPRDYTVQILREVDGARGVFRRAWVLANDAGPAPCADCVRVQQNTGSWIVERVAPGHCKLRYYLHLDPGGSIPAWLANLAHRRGLVDVYEAIEERAELLAKRRAAEAR